MRLLTDAEEVYLRAESLSSWDKEALFATKVQLSQTMMRRTNKPLEIWMLGSVPRWSSISKDLYFVFFVNMQIQKNLQVKDMWIRITRKDQLLCRWDKFFDRILKTFHHKRALNFVQGSEQKQQSYTEFLSSIILQPHFGNTSVSNNRDKTVSMFSTKSFAIGEQNQGETGESSENKAIFLRFCAAKIWNWKTYLHRNICKVNSISNILYEKN